MSTPWTAHRLQDCLLAALLAVLGVAEVLVPFTSVMGTGSRASTIVLTLATCTMLIWRRDRPLLVATVVLVGWPIGYLLASPLVLFWGQFVPMMVTVYSVARHARGRGPFLGLALGAFVFVFADLVIDVLQEPGEIVFHWMVFLIVWSVGFGLRTWVRRAEASERRAVQIEQSSRERTLAALADERARIARELHDVVAHAVSLMVVQSGAARQVVRDDPGLVEDALDTIRTTGTGALDEMRRLVTLLRVQEDPGLLAPSPGVAELAGLLEQARAGGLSATLRVEGQERPLPAGLDLTAYRIVQEALTNVRRHAEATAVEVLLRYGSDDLQIEVRDDGKGLAPAATGSAQAVPKPGHGFVGMRERASLYGGRVETLPSGGTGLTVRAVLPAAVQ